MHSADVHWGTILTAAGILAPLFVAALIFTHRKLLRPLRLMTDDWHGAKERRGAAGQLIAEARPGVMERLMSLDTRQERMEGRQDQLDRQVSVLRVDVAILRGDTTEVKDQLRPNGGDSLYDKVSRVADVVEGRQPK